MTRFSFNFSAIYSENIILFLSNERKGVYFLLLLKMLLLQLCVSLHAKRKYRANCITKIAQIQYFKIEKYFAILTCLQLGTRCREVNRDTHTVVFGSHLCALFGCE